MTRPCIFVLLVTSASLFAQQPVRVAEKAGAGEGPAWDRATGTLFFTGGGRISRRDSKSGRVEVWKDNSGGANGLLFDRDGRLVVCQSRERRIVRYEKDGSETVLADKFANQRFNSPNDLTIDSHGRVYFSDPRYGNRDSMELSEEAVYRIDAPGKVARVIGKAEGIQRPNGLLVSRNDEFLYIADNNNDAGGTRRLLRFRLKPDGTLDLASRKVVFDWGNGRGPDGMKSDESGRLYVAAGRTKARPPQETAEHKGGIYVIAPEGKLEAFYPVPDDEVTNCAFGGADGRTLFITAGGNLWMIENLRRAR